MVSKKQALLYCTAEQMGTEIHDMGFTLCAVAQKAGIGAATLHRLLNHEHHRMPTREVLNKLISLRCFSKELRTMLKQCRDFEDHNGL